MAHKDSNHSSTQRTILWIIIPATIFVSLMFTRLNHKMEPPRQDLSSDFSVPAVKKADHGHEAPAMEEHAPAADTTHADTAHAEQHAAPAAEHPAHH